MFTKILIANRGEIAVRVIRTCHDMGIATVAVYEPADRDALHVRLADEAAPLAVRGYLDQARILQIATSLGVDAIHPGYGFLAERPEFIRACEEAGIAFIGPSSQVVDTLGCKVDALKRVEQEGIATPRHSSRGFGPGDFDALRAEADRVGYPLVVKSCRGGRGRGERMVRSPERLTEAVRRAQAEALTVYGDQDVYLERAILPARQVEVQLLRDRQGTLVHLGERDGSIQHGNQKLFAETPAPYLTPQQRERLWNMALQILPLFDYTTAGSVEFLVDGQGAFYFTEIKARLQIEHPATEMVTGLDIVREQIRLAAGEALGYTQADVQLRGHALQCRVNAEDPWQNFLPNPGRLDLFRTPGGPCVRVDSYAHTGAEVSERYDPMLAKLTVWGENRAMAVDRMRRALAEFDIRGIQTTLPMLRRLVEQPRFSQGDYTTDLFHLALLKAEAADQDLRDLAVAAALAYLGRYQAGQPTLPARVQSGWHRDSRKLPS
ncbi:MAG: ATP-grasp domain-containing protein [Anaerolineae bacterium]|nr:ATP-grasp domain-containing protein [Anaerolineae bacterium]